MIARIYHSDNTILKFALEDIYRQFHNDFFMDTYDFIIFAINSDYPYNDIHYSIKKILRTNNYVAFYAIDAFCNADTVQGVVALFIKFENEGKISTYYQNGFEEVEECVSYLKKDLNDLHVVLSTASEKLPTYIEKLNSSLEGNRVFLIGGISSGNLDKDEVVTYQYIDNQIIKEGFMIITFKNVKFAKGISLGYQPIGPVYRVNLAKDNRVYVAEYTDASLIAERLLKNMSDRKIQNLWYSPIVILNDTDGIVDVVRTFKDFKEGEYVEFFGPVKNDQHIKLSFATEEMLLKSDKEEAEKIKGELSHIELGFNFSCIARQYSLGDKQKEETKLYAESFNAPIFGFFTFGEIGMNKRFDSLKFYNQTSLICGLKEK